MAELVLDLEIIRDPRSTPFIPEKGPRERTDPAEKIAFDPNFNMICVAGFCRDWKTYSFGLDDFEGRGPDAEHFLLMAIWNELATADKIITFSGYSFDIPFLMRRSWYNDVRPSKRIDMRKYTYGNHIDVRMVLGNWDTYSRGNLDLYCNLKSGCGKTDGIDGSKIQGLWDAGKYEEVKAYCMCDAGITYDLYQSLKGYYLPMGDDDVL